MKLTPMHKGPCHTHKLWKVRESNDTIAGQLSRELNISDGLASLLAQRGIQNVSEAEKFLAPTLDELPAPFTMKGIEEASQKVIEALTTKLPIILYGDYDVDGVTGIAVLANFLQLLGDKPHCMHPDRFHDGYGLKARLILETETALLHAKGLVITVDCGISDTEEVAALKKHGWSVIITDHHQPPETLPAADIIVNPWQKGCSFPFKELAGVGVAFYLVMGIRHQLNKTNYWRAGEAPNLKQLLDLVAIGTIADMVPLTGVNRVLVKAGLQVLENTKNQGLAALKAFCDIRPGEAIGSDDIGYLFGPRLNAAGRMENAGLASEILIEQQSESAKQKAGHLEELNRLRRELTAVQFEEAMEQAMAHNDGQSACLVLANSKWHLGLIGILSSRLVDHFQKPVVVFTGNGRMKGSVRSVDGINIYDALCLCEEYIVEFGGHSGAAGLTIEAEKLTMFSAKLESVLADRFSEQALDEKKNHLIIDCEIENSGAEDDIDKYIAQLAPFGQGNHNPVFALKNPCALRNLQVIGKEGKHLRFSVYLKGKRYNVIGFGFGDVVKQLASNEICARIAFDLRINRFNGQSQQQLYLHDIIIHEHEMEEMIVPA